MKREELIKVLEETAEIMENDKGKYSIQEKVEPGRGEGYWNFQFVAKKKSGFVKALKIIAAETVAAGAGLGYQARKWAYNEDLSTEIKSPELSMIIFRWSETIPDGYIETIGRTIILPDKDAYIKLDIKPKKKIELTINFAKLKEMEQLEQLQITIPEECPKCKVPLNKEQIQKLKNREIIECQYCQWPIEAKKIEF